jgi:NCS1 family nucleobase:cation symporter-1
MVWAQLGAIMSSKVLVMFLGCATTSATAGFLGQTYWNVWDLYLNILLQFWSPAARAGIVFVSLGMMLSVVATNAGTNSLPVGADLAGIAPRWINICRGQVFCALLAPLLVPWKIIADAASFLAFLGSYTVFLCPICAIMIVDYFIIRKGNVHTPSIYDTSSTGLYKFFHGWNLRAMVAWVCGVVFVVHGVAGSIKPTSVSQASKNMYKLGFILSFLMGGIVYYGLCMIWPVQVLPTAHEGEVLGFEQLALTDGYFEGESERDITGEIHGVARSDTGSELVSELKVLPEEKAGACV